MRNTLERPGKRRAPAPRPDWWDFLSDEEIRICADERDFPTTRYLEAQQTLKRHRAAPQDGNETGACPVCKAGPPDAWGGACSWCDREYANALRLVR